MNPHNLLVTSIGRRMGHVRLESLVEMDGLGDGSGSCQIDGIIDLRGVSGLDDVRKHLLSKIQYLVFEGVVETEGRPYRVLVVQFDDRLED